MVKSPDLSSGHENLLDAIMTLSHNDLHFPWIHYWRSLMCGGPRGNSVPGEVVGQSSLPSLAPPRNSVPPRPHRGFEPGPLDLELDANPTRLQALKEVAAPEYQDLRSTTPDRNARRGRGRWWTPR